MEAFTIAGIALGGLVWVFMSWAVHQHAVEKYDYRPFKITNLIFLMIIAGFAVAAFFMIDRQAPDGFGLNAIVMVSTSAILFLGYTVYLIRKMSFAMGIMTAILQVVAAIVVAATLILWHVARSSGKARQAEELKKKFGK